MSDMPIPVFVVGVARSGTTLVSRMIASHSVADALVDSLASIQKSVYIELARDIGIDFTYDTPLCDSYFSIEKLRLAHAAKNVDLCKIDISAHKKYFCEGVTQASGAYNAVALDDDFFATINTLPEAINKILEAAGARGHRLVALKDNYAIELIWALKRAFPNAKFIFPYRDPRAVVASRISGAKKFGVSGNVHLMSRIRAWRAHIAWAFAAQNDFIEDVLMIPYEELTNSPNVWTKQLCVFLRLEYEDDMLGCFGFSQKQVFSSWNNNSSFDINKTGIFADSVDRWKDILHEDMIKGIEYLAFHEMKLLGYQHLFLSGPPYMDQDAYAFLQNDRLVNGVSWRCDTKSFELEVESEQQRHAIIQKKSGTIQDIEYYLLSSAIADKFGVRW